jgi:2-polyprenyl-3-methyl-5-hydroxy-6-metoxy-1,4-benzoquinol methylase
MTVKEPHREGASGRRRIEEMNAYYDKVAPLHDGFMGYTSNRAMEGLLRPIIQWIEPFVMGGNVLEVACGTGNWTQVLSKRARSVTAVDQSDAYLKIARTKEYQGENVSFVKADAYSLDTVEGVFEAVFAADWWSHIPKSCIGDFVDSLMMKLEPRGAVVILDMLPSPTLDAMFSHCDGEGNVIHRRSFEDGSSFEVVKNFPTESELREAFGRYGESMSYRRHNELRRWLFTLVRR